MKSTIIKIAVVCSILAIVVGLVLFNYYNSRIEYIDSDVIGNTTGNINNGGLFCEYNDTIYFANPYDSNCLYSMNKDCTNVKKLSTDSVSYINTAGKYIFYVRNNLANNNTSVVFKGLLYGIVRCNLDGTHDETIHDGITQAMSLSGNNLYYQHYAHGEEMSLHTIKIDGSNDTLIEKFAVSPANVKDTYIYFSNPLDKNNIYRFNTNAKMSSMYLEANSYMVDMRGVYVYYIDLANNYRLVRVKTTTGEKESVTKSSDGRCISYNVYNNKIFYVLEGDNAGLYRSDTDGSNSELIFPGSITNVNCTSSYTFFSLFDSNVLFRVPTTGNAIAEQIVLQ